MISNPVSYFINGSTTREFTHEGGHTLYHFCPHDCGLSKNFEDNVVFFADSEVDALRVLKAAWEFGLARCAEYVEYQKAYAKKYSKPRDDAEYHYDRRKHTIDQLNKYLAALEAGQVKVSKAPVDQFYVVGWASNDTCFQ